MTNRYGVENRIRLERVSPLAEITFTRESGARIQLDVFPNLDAQVLTFSSGETSDPVAEAAWVRAQALACYETYEADANDATDPSLRMRGLRQFALRIDLDREPSPTFLMALTKAAAHEEVVVRLCAYELCYLIRSVYGDAITQLAERRRREDVALGECWKTLIPGESAQ
ncbi:MAG: hypothetical protein QM784_17600 [Polyangiaceae bacterium]